MLFGDSINFHQSSLVTSTQAKPDVHVVINNFYQTADTCPSLSLKLTLKRPQLNKSIISAVYRKQIQSTQRYQFQWTTFHTSNNHWTIPPVVSCTETNERL